MHLDFKDNYKNTSAGFSLPKATQCIGRRNQIDEEHD